MPRTCMAAPICNPSTGEEEAGGSSGLLASSSSCDIKFWIHGEALSQKLMSAAIEKDINMTLRPIYRHTWTCTPIHTYNIMQNASASWSVTYGIQ